MLDSVRAAWPPVVSGSGPATGREDLSGTAVLEVLDLGDWGSGRAVIALANSPSLSRVQAVPLIDSPVGWRRADAGDGVSARLVHRLGEALDPPETSGSLRLRSWACPSGSAEGERAVAEDQTNESVIVGDAAVVKWLRPVPETTSRALRLTSHLAEVGFTGIPRPLGALLWRAPSGAEVALAHVDAFLPGAEDGYTWCVDALLSHLESCPPDCHGSRARCRAWFGGDLGRLTAELHAALATHSSVLPDATSMAPVDGFIERGSAVLDEALAETRGEASAWLSSHADRLRQSFTALPRSGETPVSPIHGDLHVGQVLRWDGGLAVIDFDGNPTLEAHELAEPVARDVAQMTCSVDHVGRIVDRRTEGRHHDRVEDWISASRGAFLDSYTSVLVALDRAPLLDPRLITAFEVEQECRELIYAAHYLPRWTYAPLGALRARFGGD